MKRLFAVLLIPCGIVATALQAAPPAEQKNEAAAGAAIKAKQGAGLSSEGGGLSAQGSALIGSASGLGAYETELGTALSLSADVLFDFDKADLKPAAMPRLQQLAELIKQKKPKQVQIHGHTDAKGAEDYNLKLSQRRADAVAAWLASQGVGRELLATQGFGESHPVAPNQNTDGSDNPEGRQKNRRVDVLLAKAFASIQPIRRKP